MRTMRRLFVASLAVLITFCTALIWLLSTSGTDTDDGVKVFSQRAIEDVKDIFIENEYGEFFVMYDDFEGGYVAYDIPVENVDIDALLSFMTSAGSLSARELVNAASSGEYGLDEPAAKVKINYHDGASFEFLLGNRERVSGAVYVQPVGEKAVYLMQADAALNFLQPAKAFVDHRLTPALEHSSALSAILDVEFERGGEKLELKSVAAGGEGLRRAAMSFGTATHLLKDGVVFELDQTYGGNMLQSLLDLLAHDIVDYNVDEKAFLKLGLSAPYMRVSFGLKNGPDAPVEQYDIQLFSYEKESMLATCNNNGVIYIIDRPAFADAEFSSFALKHFLSPLIMDLNSIKIGANGTEYEFILIGERNADKRVTLNGKEIDINHFRAFYTLLSSAAFDSGRVSATPLGEPLLEVEYVYLDSAKAPDSFRLYTGDLRRLLVEVNGAGIFDMREQYLDYLLEALRKLEAGEGDIETIW